MRQCVFVVGSPDELAGFAPMLRQAADSRLRHSIWYTAPRDASFGKRLEDFGLSSKFVQNAAADSPFVPRLAWLAAVGGYYRCFRFIDGARTWTGRSPLVVVHGYRVSTWLAGTVGRWGGAQVVHLHDANSATQINSFFETLLRRRILQQARYALCPDNVASLRATRYPGCVVVNTGDGQGQIRLAVNALLRWTGSEPES